MQTKTSEWFKISVLSKIFPNHFHPRTDDSELEKIRTMIKTTKLQDVENHIKKIGNKNFKKNTRLHIEIFKALILSLKGDTTQALQIMTPIHKQCSNSSSLKLQIDYFSVLSDICWRAGKHDACIENITKTKEIITANQSKNFLSDFLNNKLGEIYNTEGIVNWYIGNTTKSLLAFKNSLVIKEKCGEKREIAILHNNIGNIFFQRGDLDIALNHFQKSKDIRTQIDDKIGLASTANNLGDVYATLGDTKLAIQQYVDAKQIFEWRESHQNLAKTLFFLVKLSLEEKLPFCEFEKEIENLFSKYKEKNNPLINLYYDMSKAAILVNNDRLWDKFSAGTIFKNIVFGNCPDPEMKTLSAFYVIDIILLEIRISGNEELMTEIHSIINYLKQLSLKEKLYPVLIRTLVIESKLSLIDLQINKAKDQLTKAHKLAEEHKLSKLSKLVSYELDKLLSEWEKWHQLIVNGSNVPERISKTAIESTVRNMVSKRETALPTINKEIPKAFLIINSSGITVYSKTNGILDKSGSEQLIGGFISAINSFGKTLFDANEIVERIKYGNYLILSKNIDSYLLCYIFDGDSYFAFKTLEKIASCITESETIMKRLREPDNKSLSIHALLEPSVVDAIINQTLIDGGYLLDQY